MNATVADVAAYFLAESGTRMTTMKLQKLCYYGQAWSLVWDNKNLFNAPIYAWANGPVIPELFKLHKGKYYVVPGAFDKYGADLTKLDADQAETCDAILDSYGKFTGVQLSHLTHREAPWINARGNRTYKDKGGDRITPEALVNYYGDDSGENLGLVEDLEIPNWVI